MASNSANSSTKAEENEIFGLLSLPVELRIKIYEHVFSDHFAALQPTFDTIPPWCRAREVYGTHPNLLAICHQLRAEALPTYRTYVERELKAVTAREVHLWSEGHPKGGVLFRGWHIERLWLDANKRRGWLESLVGKMDEHWNTER